MNSKNNEIIVEPFAKSKLKIRFEYPKPPKDNTVKGKDKKSKEKDKKSKGKIAGSVKSSRVSKINNTDENVSYVAKYNLLLGGIELMKDIIIIGTFK